MTPPLAVLILAAGQGKRMQDPSKPKVLYHLGGQPLLGHVLKLAQSLGPDKIVVIVGYGRDKVTEYIQSQFPEVETVVQAEQLGTGHAIEQARSAFQNFTGNILVLSGDVPLLSPKTVRELIDLHVSKRNAASVLTVEMDDPKGYGRIIRDGSGQTLKAIVEEKDADEATREIREINSGIYVFDAKTLFQQLTGLDKNNAQGEYYLTDVFGHISLSDPTKTIGVYMGSDPIEVSGINTKDQLDRLEKVYYERKAIR